MILYVNIYMFNKETYTCIYMFNKETYTCIYMFNKETYTCIYMFNKETYTCIYMFNKETYTCIYMFNKETYTCIYMFNKETLLEDHLAAHYWSHLNFNVNINMLEIYGIWFSIEKPHTHTSIFCQCTSFRFNESAILFLYLCIICV